MLLNNSSGCYVTKEATGATNEANVNACTDNCKIEETNRVEGNASEMKNNAVDDKEIVEKLGPFVATNSRVACCDCHRDSSAVPPANKKSDKEGTKGEKRSPIDEKNTNNFLFSL